MMSLLADYERTPGTSYGSIEGGVHYKNLSLISDPIVSMSRKKWKLADFGGGSGIVGLHTLSRIPDADLYIIDGNPSQLEGVPFEASKYRLENSPAIIERNLLELDIYDQFDGGTMRMVLNYMNKDQIRKALSNICASMKMGSLFVNCAMVALSNEQQIFYNDFRYPSSDMYVLGNYHAGRHIPTLQELHSMQKDIFGSCQVIGMIKMDQTSQNVQKRFSLSDAETGSMISQWQMAPEKAKMELNLRVDDDGVCHYDWLNAVFTCMKS